MYATRRERHDVDYTLYRVLSIDMGTTRQCPDRGEFGDDTSMAGVINDESLIDRLIVRPSSEPDGGTVCDDRAQFVGQPIRGFVQRTFGGHLVAQALMASAATVSDPRRVANSLHVYFLSSGTHEHPLDYEVDTIRDGGSFSIRETTIVQNGRRLARVSASFCLPSAIGSVVDEFISVHTVPAPEELEPLYRRRTLGLPPDSIKLPTGKHWQTASRPVDIRYIDNADSRRFWFRTAAADGGNQNEHRAVLAFASDRSLLPVIAHARGDLEGAHTMRSASIDHALWFHADVRSGDWYLYVQDSPFHTARSGLARGTIFNRAGRLVASVTQQGLIFGECLEIRT